jgi:dTDP-4-dehydrorhamnose 3,5-epimerase-like enzyme
MERLWFGGKAAELTPSLHVDERGVLTVLAFDRHRFAAVRTFIVEAPDGTVRGGHRHRRGRQLLVQLSGSIDIELRYGGGVERLTLDGELRAILVEPPVWASQTYRGEHASLLVLCDTAYDADDYFEDPV